MIGLNPEQLVGFQLRKIGINRASLFKEEKHMALAKINKKIWAESNLIWMVKSVYRKSLFESLMLFYTKHFGFRIQVKVWAPYWGQGSIEHNNQADSALRYLTKGDWIRSSPGERLQAGEHTIVGRELQEQKGHVSGGEGKTDGVELQDKRVQDQKQEEKALSWVKTGLTLALASAI